MATIGATSKRVLVAALAAATFGGTLATSTTSAQAQFVYGGGYGGGYYGGGYGRGFYGRGYRPVGYYGGGRYYRGRRNAGGAIAAGVIGGLALGALAASARPSYGYYGGGYAPAYYGGYGGGYAPVYGGYQGGYAPVGGYGGGCVVERRRFVDPYGRFVTRRERVCY